MPENLIPWHPYTTKGRDQSLVTHALKADGNAYCGAAPGMGWMGGELLPAPPRNGCRRCAKLTRLAYSMPNPS